MKKVVAVAILLAFVGAPTALGVHLWRIRSGNRIVEAVTASFNREEWFKGLLEDDPSLVHAWNTAGWQALHAAAHYEEPETVRVLLRHGADPNAVSRDAWRCTPLHMVAWPGLERPSHRGAEVIDLLVTAGAKVEVHASGLGDFTPLMLAVFAGNVFVAKKLIECGADVNAQARDGRTALDRATGNAELQALLRQAMETGRKASPEAQPSARGTGRIDK